MIANGGIKFALAKCHCDNAATVTVAVALIGLFVAQTT
jgi:hypothetical protein